MPEKSHKQLKEEADAALFDALVAIGFYRNEWNFDPVYVRILLRWLTVLFAVLSAWSWSHVGGYRWMFTSFGTVLGLLFWYWYTSVECGGGKFIFSPEWKDSFVRSQSTSTNYVVKINVGYMLDIHASIPYSAFEFEEDGKLDVAWLADELEQHMPMRQLQQRQARFH